MMTVLIRMLVVAAAGFAAAAPAMADELSTSIMRPTAIDPFTGIAAGKFPGGEGPTSYYFAVDLRSGSLVTQLQIVGRSNTPKKLTFELLSASARVADYSFIMADSEAKKDGTKTYAIDSAGRYVIRLIVDGKETNSFCVMMGGSALPEAKSPGCPSTAAVSVPVKQVEVASTPIRQMQMTAPGLESPAGLTPPTNVEVIVSKCEERLRVGSDFLFDFDRAKLRPEADPALQEITHRVAAAGKTVLIEGHTDAKGTDAYNQGLSERRA